MEFDRFTVMLLIMGPAPARPAPGQPDTLQDEHLAYLAHLHSTGVLLAAGPYQVADRPEVRGLSLFTTDPDETRALAESDPAVVAGRFTVEIAGWTVPARVIVAGDGHLPRSVAEVRGQAS